MRRAIANSTMPMASSTHTCGHSSVTGRSRQKTFVKPSMAHALIVQRPAFCMAGGIRKRGNMLPPMADMTRMNSVESAPNCARVRHKLANNMPKAATANAVLRPMTTKPGICEKKSSLKTAQAQRNMTVSCAKASRMLKTSLPASRPVMLMRELSTRSSVPDSASSNSAPAEPLAVKSRNMTPMAAA